MPRIGVVLCAVLTHYSLGLTSSSSSTLTTTSSSLPPTSTTSKMTTTSTLPPTTTKSTLPPTTTTSTLLPSTTTSTLNQTTTTSTLPQTTSASTLPPVKTTNTLPQTTTSTSSPATSTSTFAPRTTTSTLPSTTTISTLPPTSTTSTLPPTTTTNYTKPEETKPETQPIDNDSDCAIIFDRCRLFAGNYIDKESPCRGRRILGLVPSYPNTVCCLTAPTTTNQDLNDQDKPCSDTMGTCLEENLESCDHVTKSLCGGQEHRKCCLADEIDTCVSKGGNYQDINCKCQGQKIHPFFQTFPTIICCLPH